MKKLALTLFVSMTEPNETNQFINPNSFIKKVILKVPDYLSW
jgi:hypothetical protein